jgi:hypothetical protein
MKDGSEDTRQPKENAAGVVVLGVRHRFNLQSLSRNRRRDQLESVRRESRCDSRAFLI